MSQKHLRLVDNRGCTGAMKRELRKALRGIDAGDIVSMSFVYIRRDGSLRAQFDCDCPIRALGSVDLLRDYIKTKKFEQL